MLWASAVHYGAVGALHCQLPPMLWQRMPLGPTRCWGPERVRKWPWLSVQPLALQLMIKTGCWGADGVVSALAGGEESGRRGFWSPSGRSSESLSRSLLLPMSLARTLAVGLDVLAVAVAGGCSLRAAWGTATAVPAAAHAGARPSSTIAKVIEPRILFSSIPT